MFENTNVAYTWSKWNKKKIGDTSGRFCSSDPDQVPLAYVRYIAA
jgi:hypothetical protein